MLFYEKLLIEEFKYYIKNKHKIAESYSGRFIVIKDNRIIGDYGSSFEAHLKTKINHLPETYLVLFCPSDPFVSKTPVVYRWELSKPLDEY